MNRNKDNEKSDKVDNIQGKGEPSKDLLDRLVYGKKANVLTITILTLKINIILNLNQMSQKEMRDVNKKLLEKFAKEKLKKIDYSGKNEELSKRMEANKQYTDVI